MDVQQRINLTLLRRFNEARIQFAFPTRTLYVENSLPLEGSPEQASHPDSHPEVRSGIFAT